jgi:uncharacterized protein (DUF433 family)
MSDERDRSGSQNPSYSGEPERAEGPVRERDPNGRDPYHRPDRPERQGGYGDADQPGMHRGPRRSRYGRRRMPNDGPGDYQDHRDQRQHRPDQSGDDVDNYLPSFIAGPNGGADPHADQGPRHGGGYNPDRPPSQPGQGPAMHQGQHGGGYQPQHQAPSHHGGYQGGQPPMHHPEHHQPHQPIQPEEPSPEVQAAAAEFAKWEDSNPQLRGLLVCNPTFKRGEPIVRGTRIPARILAAIANMGTSVDEMLQDYPALTREGLDAALAFAAAHPRGAR